ncbi:carbohydrate porin [Reyranella sp. CPCC 100927]|uniref:carbohydrate porin n=1 Tax=Reyranella sp. CPCC 100927 TaxID=2599616 RepID=UPI0011B72FDA|nr:carbohydrate porin [Reyranella sp. CPCC 100927]TWT15647.1 carbohydrate porin [Reyranella sp. CPCC 100927]
MAVNATRRIAAALVLPGFVSGALAQAPADPAPPPPPSIAPSLGTLGDPGGVRATLREKGITYGLSYTGEVFGTVRGGLKRGTVYEGKLELQVDIDLATLAGLSGLAFHANAVQLHGRGPTRRLVGNLMTTSSIEALPATRLVELWLEQTLFDGMLAVRAGQLAADSEFMVSDTASLFINGTFGWPTTTSANLPGGGISYPWATPGVRVKLVPAPGVTVLAAVFNGDPSGGGSGEPLRHNQHGIRFPLHNAPFFIGEASWAYNQDKQGLPGTIKAGGWYHAGRFDDRRFAIDGLALNDPAGSGIARRHRGNGGFYAIVDQTLWRTPDSGRGIAAFARVSTSPGDRNEVSFYADGGVSFKGVLAARPDDIAGIAFGYSRLSRGARAHDRDDRALAPSAPIRSGELLVEATYLAQIVPGWSVQPDVQYIRRPGGGTAHPTHAPRRIKDAVVIGLRTTIQY